MPRPGFEPPTLTVDPLERRRSTTVPPWPDIAWKWGYQKIGSYTLDIFGCKIYFLSRVARVFKTPIVVKDPVCILYGFIFSGVHFINCFPPNADRSRPTPKFYSTKKLLKRWAYGMNCRRKA